MKAPLLFTTLIISAVTIFRPVASTAASAKPNVIFILADDLGYGDIGCYGQKEIKTPNIDRIAAEGMRFTSMYAGCTVCGPSRCALMTGVHTGHGRIRGNSQSEGPLQSGDTTVAELMKQAGYHTGCMGKWGLGHHDSTGFPTHKGFDEFFGYETHVAAHNYYPEFLWKNDSKYPLKNVVAPTANGGGVASVRVDYAHDLIAREALDFIERAHDKPFFLYLAFTIPHANNENKKNGMEVPDYGPYASKDWPEIEKCFASMVTRMDSDIGRVLDLLKKDGIDQNTVVFFTSDNGAHKEGGHDPEFFHSHGALRGIKRDLWDGGIHVPGMVRWPGKIKPGQVSDQTWAFWDFLPTAAELAGLTPPEGIDGISIVPTLLGEPQKQKQHEYLYWEFHERGFGQALLLGGKWKAVRLAPTAPIELYDLKADLAEEHNLAAEHPDIVAKIDGLWKTARTDSADWPINATAGKKKAAKQR